MLNYFKISFFIIIPIFLSSCAPSVSISSNGVKRSPKPDSYEMMIVKPYEQLSDSCKILGDIKVYDAGLAVNCGFNKVLNKLIKKAKLLGADAIKIVKINPPDMLSTCYRIEALAVSYDGINKDSLSYSEILAPPDTSFISFKDCYPPKDYGNIDSIAKHINTIDLIPFFPVTAYKDSLWNVDEEQITANRIRKYILAQIKKNNKDVIFVDKSFDDYKKYLNYTTDILKKASLGKGNPLDWGENLELNTMDPSAIIYMPIAVERESQRSKKGRFYILLANMKGKILFSRSINYDPAVWSYHYSKFVEQAGPKLPLASY